jgi:class 3 adenylate cyclase/tetratricopeptide (TPR) repeat protein
MQRGAEPPISLTEEHKQATVLFADIVGSTQLIAGLDAEEAVERLRPALAVMRDSVEQFDGTVVRTMGDGIMALFGAPRAHEGHAVLACSAAITMQEAIAKQKAPAIRIGLHSGLILSGALSLVPTKETAQGVAIHIASRTQAIAEPGSTCITSACYRLVRGYYDVRSLGPQWMKGFTEPIGVYKLVGRRPGISDDQFRRAAFAPFRGRTAELTVLERALESSERGGAAVGISAAPGVGKSRLCYEFAQQCRRRGIPVIETRALTYGHATPFQPILELLRAFFRILPADEPVVAKGRVADKLLALDPTFESDLPLLTDFLGLGDPAQRPSALDPVTRLARLRDLVRKTVKLAGTATSVIIFEDLHWLDDPSQEFLETIVEAAADSRTVLVLTFRPIYHASWMRLAHYHRLELQGLSAEPIRQLVDGLIGNDSDLLDVRERIIDRSGGNPFFAEELIYSLIDAGALTGKPGNYQLNAENYRNILPATVHAVIGDRIDRIGDQAKAVLQVAAIIGDVFLLAVVERVAEMPADDVRTALNRLCDLEILQHQGDFEMKQFAFRHPLIREVAYTTQLKSRRTTVHASVARALDDFHGDRTDEFAGLIAYHFEAAGQLSQASKFTVKAANWVGKTDSDQALKYWKKVRELLRVQPRSAQSDKHRINACGRILHFGWRARQGMMAEEAKPYADEALQLAEEIDERMIQTLVLVGYGRIVVGSGPADEYVALAKKALSLIPDNHPRTVTLNGILSQAYTFAGLFKEALDTNTRALESLSRLDQAERHVLGFNIEDWILCLRARILVLLGQFEEAAKWLELATATEASRHVPVVHFIPHLAYAELAWCRLEPQLAAEHATRVFKIAEQSAIPYLHVVADCCAGLAASAGGDYAQATRSLERAVDRARRTRAGLEFEARALADLADAHYRGGHSARAMAIAEEAIAVSRRRTARAAECHATIIRAAAGTEANTSELYERAAELIRTSGAEIYAPLLSVWSGTRPQATERVDRTSMVNSRNP